MTQQTVCMEADICVIGGGAAGMTAALAAYRAEPSLKILLLEARERIGQKLLVTGNGRCNLSNTSITMDCYNPEAVRYREIFEQNPEDSSFFGDLGLMLSKDDSGRIYPYSNQASSVLNAFLKAFEKAAVQIVCNARVREIAKEKDSVLITTADGRAYRAKYAVIATGSPAGVKENRSEDLIRQNGDSYGSFEPGLVPLRIRGNALRPLKGLRFRAEVSLYCNGEKVREESGEVQIGDGYLGGICIMDLSRYLEGKNNTLSLNLVPGLTAEMLLGFLYRYADGNTAPAASLLDGILPKRLGEQMVKSVITGAFSRTCESLSREEIGTVADRIVNWELEVESTCPVQQAQVCRGGVRELDPETLRSPGNRQVFYCGEIVDVDGKCGGFNLHWAWISGLTAGKAAAAAAGGMI